MTEVPTPPIQAFNQWAESIGWPAVCYPELAFEAEILGTVLAVWRELAQDGAIPRRSQLSPRKLMPCLRNIVIMERHTGPVRHYIRLMGTGIIEVLGHLQGKYVEDVADENVASHYRTRFDLTHAEGRPLRFISRVDFKRKYFLSSESLWAPLAGEDGEGPMVLMAAILRYNDMPDISTEAVSV